MTLTVRQIICDVTPPNNVEFAANTARLVIALSAPDVDTVTNDLVSADPIIVPLSATGEATVNLWPNQRGTRGSIYSVMLEVTQTPSDFRVVNRYSYGYMSIADGAGSLNLSALVFSGLTPVPADAQSLVSRILLPDGSAAFPAVTFNADDNTGLWRIGNDVLGFATNGTERLRLTTTGAEITGLLTGTAVTQGANDSTTGRLMKVFDFGIGNLANTSPISSSGPLSTFPSGLSRISGGTTEQPAGVGTGTVFTACNQSGRMAQQVHSTQDNKLYIRSSHDSVWTAWAEIMSSNNVTQTDIDTTAGRLMKVGDYGLGRAAGVYPPEYDFNTWGANPSGMYWYNNTGDAGPSGYGTVIALNYAAAKQHRIALSSDDSRMYIGSISASGIQSTWSEIFGQKNILGTVSQSGGVPTGAVIERGSNANGGYVRFADGTQICWGAEQLGTASTASGSVFVSNGLTFTFPAAFVLAPSGVNGAVTLSSRWVSGAAAQWSGTGADVTKTQVTCRLIAAVSGSQSNVSYIAIGRWF